MIGKTSNPSAQPDDSDTYDHTMHDQARTAVLINPGRIRGNRCTGTCGKH